MVIFRGTVEILKKINHLDFRHSTHNQIYFMKNWILISIAIGFASCQQPAGNEQVLNQRIAALEQQLADTYKPGMGEFMGSIQAHHSKLWFAGKNENWKLADFEVHEIKEALEDIQKFQAERKESELMVTLNPALDSINFAIQQKNLQLFKYCFSALTNSCNNCHRATEFEFNLVKVPETSPFTNQDFKVEELR